MLHNKSNKQKQSQEKQIKDVMSFRTGLCSRSDRRDESLVDSRPLKYVR